MHLNITTTDDIIQNNSTHLVHLCGEVVTPLIAVDRIPRVYVGIRDPTHHPAGQTVHEVIGEYGRAGDAEHPVDLGRYRIDNGAISRCFVVINPDVHNSIVRK